LSNIAFSLDPKPWIGSARSYSPHSPTPLAWGSGIPLVIIGNNPTQKRRAVLDGTP
jgi:hypothetical protein